MWEDGESDFWEDTIREFLFDAENARVMHELKWAKTDELLQAPASGHKRTWQNVETNSGSGRRKGSGQGSKELEDRGTKENNYKNNTEGSGTNSKRDDSRLRKGSETSPEKRCCGTDVHCPRKKETF